MPSRNGTPGNYRYGFDGMENAQEWSGSSNHYLADWRNFDSRIGRWTSIDPIVKPWESSYAGFSNNPICFKDPSGLDPINGSEKSNSTNEEKPNSNTGKAAVSATESVIEEAAKTIELPEVEVLAPLTRQPKKKGGYVTNNNSPQVRTQSIGYDPDQTVGFFGSLIDVTRTFGGFAQAQKLMEEGKFQTVVNGVEKVWKSTFQGNQYVSSATVQSGKEIFAAKISVANSLEVIGRVANILGLGITITKLVSGDQSPKTKMDLVAGGVAFIPGVGWIYSATYFAGSWLIGEENMNEGFRAIEEGNRFVYDWNKDPSHDATMKIVCFASGTLILTKNGFKPIELISVNDSVYSFDTLTNKIELDIVVRSLKSYSDSYYKIYTLNDTIEVTGEHPFYSVSHQWIKAKNLKPGDLMNTVENYPSQILKIDYIQTPIIVHNIEVKMNHNYFVSISKILVHNKIILDDNNQKMKIYKKE